MSINYLSYENVEILHKMIISEFDGGLLSIDESCLEKRIVEPQTEYFGIEQYPRLFQKASVYLYKITIIHCFADGNKRTAILCTDVFLKLNGYRLQANEDELYNFALKIANHMTRPSIEYIEDWIESHVVKYSHKI